VDSSTSTRRSHEVTQYPAPTRFYRSQLYPLLQRINTYPMWWAGGKYKRLRSYKRFTTWWRGSSIENPRYSHTGLGRAGRPDLDEKS
jgi:hypothetical protein